MIFSIANTESADTVESIVAERQRVGTESISYAEPVEFRCFDSNGANDGDGDDDH